MSTINIFVSFEFGKDNSLKNQFYTQAEGRSKHNIHNHALNEPYKEEVWKDKAREAIRGCDAVFVLVGRDTHNAPGVLVETDMARSLRKPTIQILSKSARRHSYKGVPPIDDRISWNWKRIDEKLEEIWTSKRRG